MVNGQVPINKASAPADVFPKEAISIYVNSNLFLAGELLEYKVYNLTSSNTFSILSKIAYVSLLSEKDSIVFNQKLRLEEGTGHGDFFIPATLKTGAYKLIGYTNFSRNNSEQAFSQKNIYIINPFIKPEEAKSKSADSINVVKIKSRDTNVLDEDGNTYAEGIAIETDKTSYTFRDKITLTINNSMGKSGYGNYLVSVRKTAPVEISDKREFSSEEKGADENNFFIPELRGELVSGKIEALDGKSSVADKAVALTIPGKDFIFKLSKTDNNGRFVFSIDKFYETGKSVVQVNEPNREQYKLILDKKEFEPLQKKESSFLQLEPKIKNWMQERSIQLQVENAYYNIKKDSILKAPTNDPFYDNLGMEYVLDDYTRFPTVRETFVEVVTQAAIRKEGDVNKFIVFNAYNPQGQAHFNSIDPLVIMDGMLVLDNSEVINYSAHDIKSVRVLPVPYRYGPKIYSGIISIITKKGTFRPTLLKGFMQEVELQSPVNKKRYYTPDYSNRKEFLKRIPDYRVQLLWEPNLKLSEKEYSTSFYTSDIPGTYEIVLEGFTANGNYISTKNYFIVE